MGFLKYSLLLDFIENKATFLGIKKPSTLVDGFKY